MKRRAFLAAAGAAGAAALFGPWSRTARAATFGAFPAGSEPVELPDGVRARRVLEIFLYGGLSCWETLYFVRGYGTPDDPVAPSSQYYAFADANAAATASCGAVDLARPFAIDALGATVELGPFAAKLWQRSDVVARMRLVVQRHALAPHEAAVPQALTGRMVGQPGAAGLGAHVQRARIDAGATPDRASPYSYVFATGGVSSDNVAAAASSGTHPGAARPLLIKTDSATGFTQLLDRTVLGASRTGHDALVAAYADQYTARLTWPGRGRVRSAHADDAAVAFAIKRNAGAIHGVLPDDLFAAQTPTVCGRTAIDYPWIGLTAARHLLTHPSEPASYVCVSDNGLVGAVGGGGYDTHTGNAADTATNFDNLSTALLAIINAPGEADPTKLSLDDTLIILNTEFGRTPLAQAPGSDGRNHHPDGYVTAFIGGPITSDQRGVYGAIGRDGIATSFATPSENRVAALLAMGIYPFAPDGFNVSDVPGVTSELDAARAVMAKFLGRTA
ncbi:MAG TPA: DUF1501 domain-containing protein [Kofleriaceae bacterium]|jgi:hypothetical protein|nr:DUF1501 domain-containing protein [Kofleriaceae bacterium]